MEQFELMGEAAFKANNRRTIPLDILISDNGIAKCDAWFKGWDRANMAADVEGWTDEENAAWKAAREAA